MTFIIYLGLYSLVEVSQLRRLTMYSGSRERRIQDVKRDHAFFMR